MILRNATIKYKGYDPDNLSYGSKRRICVSCDQCGKVRWLPKQAYRDLCLQCSMKLDKTRQKISKNHADVSGDKNPNYGKHHSDEIKERISKLNQKEKITLICKVCYKKFNVIQSRRDAKFCSHECYGEWNSENRIGENANGWKGGIAGVRTHVLPINKCTQLNQRFKGSEGHHINRDTVIFIPSGLHNHFYHNLKNGNNMESMNLLAIQFINGGFNET